MSSSLYIKETLSETTDLNMILVSSYCKNNFHSKFNGRLPLDIIKLIAKFSENTRILFNFSGAELKRFLSTSRNTTIRCTEMNFHGIKFKVQLYPNGADYYESRQHVMIIIKLIGLPKNIKSILIYYELFCSQTIKYWRCNKMGSYYIAVI